MEPAGSGRRALHPYAAAPSRRAFGLLYTALFDAWSNYRESERSTTADRLKRPAKEHLSCNQREAISN